MEKLKENVEKLKQSVYVNSVYIESLTRLLIQKGVITENEVIDYVKKVQEELNAPEKNNKD